MPRKVWPEDGEGLQKGVEWERLDRVLVKEEGGPVSGKPPKALSSDILGPLQSFLDRPAIFLEFDFPRVT